MALIRREQGPSEADEFARLTAARQQQAREALSGPRTPVFPIQPSSGPTFSELVDAANQRSLETQPQLPEPTPAQRVARIAVSAIAAIVRELFPPSDTPPEITDEDRRRALLAGGDWMQRPALAEQAARERQAEDQAA